MENGFIHLQYLDNDLDPICRFDHSGRIIYANKAAGKLLEYTRDELVNLSLFDFDRELSKSGWNRIFRNIKDGKLAHLKLVYRRRDGSELPVFCCSIPK